MTNGEKSAVDTHSAPLIALKVHEVNIDSVGRPFEMIDLMGGFSTALEERLQIEHRETTYWTSLKVIP